MTEAEENNPQNIIMGERQLFIVIQAIQITRKSALMLKAKQRFKQTNKQKKTEKEKRECTTSSLFQQNQGFCCTYLDI